MNSALYELKDKIDSFIQNDEYLKTYYKASEAERISFAKSEGIDEGKKEGKREMIQQMKRDNVDISLIQKFSGWSKEDILSCPT